MNRLFFALVTLLAFAIVSISPAALAGPLNNEDDFEDGPASSGGHRESSDCSPGHVRITTPDGYECQPTNEVIDEMMKKAAAKGRPKIKSDGGYQKGLQVGLERENLRLWGAVMALSFLLFLSTLGSIMFLASSAGRSRRLLEKQLDGKKELTLKNPEPEEDGI